MVGYDRRQWRGSATGQTYRDLQPCSYDAYRPDPLAGRDFGLSGDVATAEAALVRLDASAAALAGARSLARLILLAESVASSRIEGLVVGGRRLLRADAVRRLANDPRDRTAEEVLANTGAMSMGVEAVGPGDPIEPAILLEMHRLLLAGTPLEEHGGRLRDQQNWIGGTGYNPVRGGVRAATPGGRGGPVRRPLRLCQRRCVATAGPGSDRARAVRDHPPVRGRQRARGPCPDPAGLAAPRAGAPGPTAHQPECPAPRAGPSRHRCPPLVRRRRPDTETHSRPTSGGRGDPVHSSSLATDDDRAGASTRAEASRCESVAEPMTNLFHSGGRPLRNSSRSVRRAKSAPSALARSKATEASPAARGWPAWTRVRGS